MIRIENLSVELGDFRLRNINLEIKEGEFFVIIGPTGSGKTVLLEAIAGLVGIDQGRIRIGDLEVTRLPPEKRGISVMYQDYSLFPHLSVRENIHYGLRYHPRGETGENRKRLDDLIDSLALAPFLNHSPSVLSGGELQRVALARALAVSPSVLLLDEPLSALDPAFRGELQLELKKLHRQTGITFLMVTHDFTEALNLAQRGAVFNRGEIEQAGEIEEIFKRPRTEFVARFVGMRNLFRAEFSGTRASINGLELETGRSLEGIGGYVAIRPEDIVISRQRLSSSMRNTLPGKVLAVNNHGLSYEVMVQCHHLVFRALITRGALVELGLEENLPVYVSFKATAVHTF